MVHRQPSISLVFQHFETQLTKSDSFFSFNHGFLKQKWEVRSFVFFAFGTVYYAPKIDYILVCILRFARPDRNELSLQKCDFQKATECLPVALFSILYTCLCVTFEYAWVKCHSNESSTF